MKYQVSVTKEFADKIENMWNETPNVDCIYEGGGIIKGMYRLWMEYDDHTENEHCIALIEGNPLSLVRVAIAAWKAKIDCLRFGWPKEALVHAEG